MKEKDLPPDTKVCNCAGCDTLLLGLTEEQSTGYPDRVRGRWRDRPYCGACLPVYSPYDAASRILRSFALCNGI